MPAEGGKPSGKKKKKRKKADRQIVANLDKCGYPLVHRAVKDMGWRVAERNEAWDFGWSDTNTLLREMCGPTRPLRRLLCVF